MKIHHTLFILILTGMAASTRAQAQSVPKSAASIPVEVVVPSLPQRLDFAGEPVPLDNYDTRESLTRDLLVTCYMHSRTMLALLAAPRYFPVIEPILKKYGVPDDFKYLCMAESGLNPNIVSAAGAAGLWQLMPAVGRENRMLMGDGVDERFHIEKATEAACRYLLDAKERLGSWTLAAASYNVGVVGIKTRLAKQGVSNYYDMFLPEETMRYVFRCLTFKMLVETPGAYGYVVDPGDTFKPLTGYTEVEVKGAPIDWSAVARQYGTTYKMLRELNHWIRDYTYPNKANRTLILKVPAKGFRN